VTATAAEIYGQRCQGCHGDRGQGGRGGIPLAASKSKPAASLAAVIKDGRNRMPSFGTQMTPAQVDGLAAYVKGL
jgi:mono/diheme cytochrome c family protein